MLLLTAAAVAISQPELPRRTTATAQARAIVRIVSAVRVRFDQAANEGVPAIRDTVVRAPDARLQRARLIEFE